MMCDTLRSVFILTITFFYLCTAYADGIHPKGVISDGTTGPAGILSMIDQNYMIEAEYGKQAGSNLFHSFQQFNLHSGESAVFSGPSSVENIISRVTGSNVSWINGRIVSLIDNANFYLLNPSGIIFGPGASLDISGSFHSSTADYLRMEDDNKFYTSPVESEVLSSAQPVAFGFLNTTPGSVTIQGKGEITQQELDDTSAGLHVSEGKSISIAAGDIRIENGTFYRVQKTDEYGDLVFEQEIDEDGNRKPVMESVNNGDIVAPSGRINLASVGSAGEVVLTESGMDVSCSKMGRLVITDEAVADVSGESGGAVYVRAGIFIADNGKIAANTSGAGTGVGIDLIADRVDIIGGGQIEALNLGAGAGGSISVVTSESIALSGEDSEGNLSVISTRNRSEEDNAGMGGSIDIDAKQLHIEDGARINALTDGPGHGGNINIQVNGSIKISGESTMGKQSEIAASTQSDYEIGGDGGNIRLNAKNLSIDDGGRIISAAWGGGAGGDIIIDVTDSIAISGENSMGYLSIINASSLSGKEWGGSGGSINIACHNLSVYDGAQIGCITGGGGKGGDIIINAEDLLSLSGADSYGEFVSTITTDTYGETYPPGHSGKIEIIANRLHMDKGASITSSTWGTGSGGSIAIDVKDSIVLSGQTDSGKYSTNITAYTEWKGDGGRIDIKADQLIVDKGAQISCATYGSGKGGDIKVEVLDLVSFSGKADEKTSSGIFVTAQSKDEWAGDGGTIYLSAAKLSIDQDAEISADTFGPGAGGNIKIFSSHLEIKNYGSIEAASEGTGTAGAIELQSGRKLVMNNGSIKTGTTQADGGNITITSSGYLYLTNSKITTSVNAESGDGGNIALEPDFIILDESLIIARAVGGDGGNIDITTNGIYRFPPESQSLIDASSKLGIDGTVSINSPESDVSSGLTVLPSSFLNADKWMKVPCASRTDEKTSRFSISGRDSCRDEFDDLLQGPAIWFGRD